MNQDSLGDRIKRDYENRTRFLLPRRTYTLIRVDGKAFHTYTRRCVRPYDLDLMSDMDATAKALCEQIGGARFAFVQSDEISVLLTDFDTAQTEAWFDLNLQKMASISASIATAAFNQYRIRRVIQAGNSEEEITFAQFDSRVFQIPLASEVLAYFQWRQQDATKNSISMTAQAHFPHDELQGKHSNALQDKLMLEKGINWNDLPTGFKRGRCVLKTTESQDREYTDKRTGKTEIAENVERSVWRVVEPPVFTANPAWLPIPQGMKE